MLKRWWIVAALFLSIPWMGCKKSGGTNIQNFFGAPPSVSEVSLTRDRRDASCSNFQDLCTCCCLANVDTQLSISIDLVTARARVVDATPPDKMNTSDILVTVLRFLDPPPPGTQINQVSLEMFDSGPIAVGHQTLTLPDQTQTVLDIYSGDEVANDGIFTRKFYFGTSTAENAGTCLEETDRTDFGGHTYSIFATSASIAPSASLGFQFTVQAIDRQGNIATSTELINPIYGTFRDRNDAGKLCCPSPCPPNSPPNCIP